VTDDRLYQVAAVVNKEIVAKGDTAEEMDGKDKSKKLKPTIQN
jgi:hypothetical protein